MPRVHSLKNNFSAGELAPEMQGRTDFDRYPHGCATLENWIVLFHGGIRTRPGLHYVTTAKTPTRRTRVVPFEFSTTQAYVIEAGHGYFRFYRDGTQLQSGGTPVEVVTPYQEEDLFALRFAQSGDVLYITHRSYAPRKLIRSSDTAWTLSLVAFDPPPSVEVGRSGSTALTLSATSGSITVTASTAAFLAADADRELVSGVGRAVLTSITSATVAQATVIDAFAGTSLAAGGWTLKGSPVAKLKPSKATPVGATLTVELRREQDSQPELVTNGDFAAGLTGWADNSAPLLASGTHTGANNAASLTDGAADFVTAGVLTTHTLRNTTDNSSTAVAAVTATNLTGTLTGGSENDWDTGDAYTVRRTGSAAATGGAVELKGGTAGIGEIRQAITTVPGLTYQLTFTVGDQPIAVKVGTTDGGSDLSALASYSPGVGKTLSFTATTTTSYLSFSNNQNSTAKLSTVSCRVFAIDGWRSDDVGRYVKVHSGIVQLTAYVNAQMMSGRLVKALSTDGEAALGSWTLEDVAWSATAGYPSAVALSEQRLWVARDTRLWGSVTGDYETFAAGSEADASVAYTLASSQLNPIHWLMAPRTLLSGTAADVARVAGVNGGPVTPSSVQVLSEDSVGSADVAPLRIGNTLLFVQREHVALLELLYDGRAESYAPDEVSKFASHLFEGYTIAELCYEPRPPSLVWAVRSDGALLACTYNAREGLKGFARVTSPNGRIESACRIPARGRRGSVVWCVVQRVVDGATLRYLEYFDEALQVDSGLTYAGPPVSTLTGLSHLEGETVQIVGDGAVYPAQTVTSGQVTGLTPAVSTAQVGLGFPCTAVLLEPEVPVAGTSQQSQKRHGEVSVRLFETQGLSVQHEVIPFRTPGAAMSAAVLPFTGKKRLTNFGWDREAQLTVTQALPLPATVLAVTSTLQVGD